MNRPLVIAALLFGSGSCALVYQTVWLRSLRLIFGSSTPSTAAVLAIFMGGLGFGALLLGSRAQRHPDPLRLYARLELVIAGTAALTPFLVEGVSAAYIAAGGAELGALGSTIVRLLLATLVLGVPVFLMGGTLPAAGRAATRASDLGRKGLALLYGVNTLGAVTGALLSTFVLFEAYGTRTTLWIACGINVLVAGLAWKLSGREEGEAEPETESVQAATEAASTQPEPVPAKLLLVAAGVSGFCFLLAELVWYRMAAPILGGSTYTFGMILAAALLGIGAGGVYYAWRGPRDPSPGRFAVTCALMVLTIIAPAALGDDLAILAHHLHGMGQRSFVSMACGWGVITALIALPPALVAGYQFPLLLALKGRGRTNVADDVGQVYAANTLGSILGSLAGGFGLVPLLGAVAAWELSALLFVPLAVVFAWRARGVEPKRNRWVRWILAVALLMFLAEGPTAVWRHTGIGAGRGGLSQPSWNAQQKALNEKRLWIVEEREGRESSLGFSCEAGYSLLVNGKSDGNAIGDASTMVMLAQIGAILHPDPKSAFVIGLGTGQTAGWMAAVPTMERVDCVELEPQVAEFADLCAATNFDVMQHPKVTHRFGDGREALLVAPRKYDLIASEPSNPFRAGIASFYTQDFYRHAQEKLASGGLFLQWLQSYEVDTQTVQIVVATLRSVFANVSVWLLNPSGDLLLVASDTSHVVPLKQVEARLKQEPYRTAFGRIAGVYDAEGVLALHLANPRLANLFAKVSGPDSLNTDDRSLLEYRFARSVGRPSTVSPLDVLQAAFERDAEFPAVEGGTVDWDRVRALRVRPWQAAEQGLPLFGASGAHAARMGLWIAASRGDLIGAQRAMQTVAPPLNHDLFERMLWARVRAQRPGTPEERAALNKELDALAQAGLATDVAWLRTQARLSDGKQDQRLVELASAAFAATREDPWVRFGLAQGAMEGLRVGVTDPAVASALARALLEGPFAVQMGESHRRHSITSLAMRAGDLEAAAQGFALSEPYPRWTRVDLQARALAYARTKHPLAEQARQDLERYVAHDSASFAELLGPR